MKKKLIRSLVWMLLLAVLAAPTLSASAAGYTWAVADGVLTVTGEGSIGPFGYASSLSDNRTTEPWEDDANAITAIVVGEGITCVDSLAFHELNRATTVSLPSTLTRYSTSAFYTYAITRVNWGGTTDQWIGMQNSQNYGAASVASYTYLLSNRPTLYIDGAPLTEVVLTADSPDVGYGAFYNCQSLTTLTVEADYAGTIGRAFENCPNLTTIRFLGGPPSVAADAFTGVTATVEYTLSSAWLGQEQSFGGTLTWVDQGGVVKQGSCGTNLSYRQLSDGTLLIEGTGAMPDYSRVGSSVTPAAPWKGNTAVHTVYLPEGLTRIGAYAFYDCAGLTDISLPASVTSIGNDAFNGCKGLTELMLPEGLTSIGMTAFNGCSGLTSMNIPESVTSIATGVFWNCTSLASVTLPGSLTSIGNDAFQNCPALTDVYYNGTEDEWTNVAGYNSAVNGRTVHYLVSARGVTSDGLSWRLLTDGTLEISGTGPMTDTSGWSGRHEELRTVVIGEGVTSIGSFAFSNAPSLTRVTIPQSVTSIYQSAFCNCSALSEIELPAGLTEINDHAFNGCTALTSITIPSGVTTIQSYSFQGCTGLNSLVIQSREVLIGEYAFDGCTGLTSASLGSGVTQIGNRAFRGCASLASVTLPNSLRYLGFGAFQDCTGLTSIAIPSGVSWLYEEAFAGCTALRTVTLGSGLQRIGTRAFSGCTSLESVTIPNSVLYLFLNAFENCSSLASVSLGTGLLAIRSEAFKGCSALTSLVIPENVTEVNEGVFTGCTGLTSLTLPASLSLEEKALQDCTSLTAMRFTPGSGTMANNIASLFAGWPGGPTTVTVDSGVTEIGSSFKNCGTLTGVSLPNTLRGLAYEAFRDCAGLTEIVLPEGLTSIGLYAFQNCTSLTSVTLPQSLTSIGEYAFRSCTELTSVVIPSGVTRIPSQTFSGCRSLTSVTLPAGLTYIGDNAFSGCSGLMDLTFPAGLTGLGTGEFQECTGLTSLTLPAGLTSLGDFVFSGCANLTGVALPAGLTTIGENAFQNCTSLADLTIPPSVTSVGHYAFYNCSSLTDMALPNGVTSVGVCVFSGCTNLTHVTIPDSVTSLGQNAFSFSGLASVTLPEGVTSIGHYAFRGCTSLASVTIPPSVTGVGSYAFQSCTGLASVTLPDSVTSLGQYAFSGCTGLTDLTLGVGLTSIPTRAFYNCTALTNVYYRGAATQWSAVTLAEGNEPLSAAEVVYLASEAGTCGDAVSWRLMTDGTLLINGTGAMTDYSVSSSPWRNRTDILAVEVDGGVTHIGDNAFSNCSALSAITLPAGLEEIGARAFYRCTGLTDVTLPDSVTTIGSFAFASCSGIRSLDLGAGLTSIGSSAFSDCTALTALAVPDSVTEIRESAFISCTGLESLSLGAGVRKIGSSAFEGCSALTVLAVPDSVTEIEPGAFAYCESLGSLSLGAGLTTVGGSAFEGCYSLTNVAVPDSVTTIGERAFADCEGLTRATLGSGLTQLGEGVFSGCLALTDLYFDGSAEQWDALTAALSDAVPAGTTVHCGRHSVTLLPCENGEAEALLNGAAASLVYDGETVTLALRPATGYEPESVLVEADGETLAVTALEDNAYAFAMPAHDVTVTVSFRLRTFTVSWLDDAGAVIDTGTVSYGATPSHADPVKDDTAEFTYSFTGWTPEIVPATEDAAYTAVFDEQRRSYTVTWEDADGSVLDTETLLYGAVPAHADLTRADTAEFSYTFTGWTPEIGPVTGETTYTAVYDAQRRSYTVAWLDAAGNEIDAESVEYGVTPSHEALSKEPTAEYSFSFNGWVPALGPVTGDKSYTAVYDAQRRSYTVTWLNEDGSVLDAETLLYGETPERVGPEREATAEFTYTFTGWTPEVSAVTRDVSYTAAFAAQRRSYVVVWLDDEGTVLDTESLLYGATPSHADPTKADTAEFTYTFTGWTPEVSAVTGDVSYMAVFAAQRRSYTVTWLDDEGTILAAETLLYGATPSRDGPEKETTAEFTYSFAGWTPEVGAVTGDVSYTAVFEAQRRSYTVTWLNEDGSVLDTESLPYGATPSRDGPEKEATAEYSYVFSGWTPEPVAVTGEASYTAAFEAVPNAYAITVETGDPNGAVSAPESARYGDEVVLTVSPARGCVTLSVAYIADERIELTPDENGVYRFTMPARAVTVEASFEHPSYPVSYDPNGGADAPAGQVKLTAEDLTLSAAAPTREDADERLTVTPDHDALCVLQLPRLEHGERRQRDGLPARRALHRGRAPDALRPVAGHGGGAAHRAADADARGLRLPRLERRRAGRLWPDGRVYAAGEPDALRCLAAAGSGPARGPERDRGGGLCRRRVPLCEAPRRRDKHRGLCLRRLRAVSGGVHPGKRDGHRRDRL